MVIAVDFDGTVVEHEFPEVGAPIHGAIETLRELVEVYDHRLILLTMRHGETLEDAIAYLTDRGVRLWAVNENPEQLAWTGSPKVFAHRYIDDAAVGCPLTWPGGDRRPYVDWFGVRALLNLPPLETAA